MCQIYLLVSRKFVASVRVTVSSNKVAELEGYVSNVRSDRFIISGVSEVQPTGDWVSLALSFPNTQKNLTKKLVQHSAYNLSSRDSVTRNWNDGPHWQESESKYDFVIFWILISQLETNYDRCNDFFLLAAHVMTRSTGFLEPFQPRSRSFAAPASFRFRCSGCSKLPIQDVAKIDVSRCNTKFILCNF